MSAVDGKVVVVTGAGSGIGRAVAIELSRRGARVSGCDLDAAGLDTTAGQCRGGMHSAVVDVSDRDPVFAYAAAVRESTSGWCIRSTTMRSQHLPRVSTGRLRWTRAGWAPRLGGCRRVGVEVARARKVLLAGTVVVAVAVGVVVDRSAGSSNSYAAFRTHCLSAAGDTVVQVRIFSTAEYMGGPVKHYTMGCRSPGGDITATFVTTHAPSR